MLSNITDALSSLPVEKNTLQKLQPRIVIFGREGGIDWLMGDYSMVGFILLNINKEDSILLHVLAMVDQAVQYGKDLEFWGVDLMMMLGAKSGVEKL